MGLFTKTTITTTETSPCSDAVKERDRLRIQLAEAKQNVEHNSKLVSEERDKRRKLEQHIAGLTTRLNAEEAQSNHLCEQVQTLMNNETTLQVIEARRAADARVTSIRLTQIGELTHERDHLRA